MNIIDYVKKTNLTFEEEPFNIVDSLILSQLIYVKIEAVLTGTKARTLEYDYVMNEDDLVQMVTLKDFYKAEYFDAMFSDGITDEKNYELFCAACASPRFRDLEIKHVEIETQSDIEKQFGAAVYVLDDKTEYVTFRGTDGSMLGWKEDFNMAFMDETPSQKHAADYINKHFQGSDKCIYIGGHSKGGNLSVYSALMSDPEIHDRIIKVYNFEGPGFRKDVMNKLNTIAERDKIQIEKVVPQTSIVGMLLSNQGEVCIVESDALGVMQHAAFTWQVKEKDFIYREDPSVLGAFSDGVIHKWLESLSDSEREAFVDDFFNLLSENGIRSVSDIRNLDFEKFNRFFSLYRNMDAESKKNFQKVFSNLTRGAFKTMVEMK